MRRALAFGLVALLFTAVACGTDTDTPDRPSITVASFNFSESVLLAEIYAQVMEDAGYPVNRNLDLGAREVIFPALEAGDLDFLPEYIGSSLSVGFGYDDAPRDPDLGHADLTGEFAEIGVTVLEYAPAQNTNVFVVTSEFAADNELETIGDLGGLDSVSFGAPPECETRETCLLGLQDTYGLDNIDFEVMPEGSTRVAALENGDIDMALLFSTDPVILERGWVALDDDQGITPVENIVPVVADRILDAYGLDLIELIDSVTAQITTEVLLDLNSRVQLDLEEPRRVAADWLTEQGLVAD